jgi:hypothetical protein
VSRRKSSFVEMSRKELEQLGCTVELVCTECGTRHHLFLSPPQQDPDGWFSRKCIMNNSVFVCDGKTIMVKGSWKLLKEAKA